MQKLYTQATAIEIEKDGKKEKLFIASDEALDRQGEIISIDGWDLSNFKSNPVVLWGHDQSRPAIGIADKLGYKTINGKKSLVYQPKFHRKDEFSRLVADLVDEGWIKTSSVGFMPQEMEDNKYIKQELLEISFVNVPANPNALSLAFSKGYSTQTIKMVMPDAKLEVEKKAIPYKKYPHASEDMDWDAGLEIKDASVEDLMKMCAWVDIENKDKKSAYKLPHHTLSGYKTVLKGCQAAMGAMMGARGGVDIPDADRQDVYNHLAKHYAEFDKEPPMMRSADEIIDKYIEGKGAEDKVNDLIKLVNIFIEEIRTEQTERKSQAIMNAEEFKKHLEKRFEDIELNVEGLSEGIKPSDEGLEQRFKNMEINIQDMAIGLRSFITKSQDLIKSSDKGDIGRKPTIGVKKINLDVEMKVLNKVNELLNKKLKEYNEKEN